MIDWIVTGASRGIGRALALASAAPERRLLLVARDVSALETVAEGVRARGGAAEVVPGDLADLRDARRLGETLRARTRGEATLIHNAGLWPSALAHTEDGLERSYAVNCAGPWALQEPLLEAERLRRILVVGAGLMAFGRFDPERTPRGADFSRVRTYCNTKLAFAVAMREVAARHPQVDVLVMHPGVVRTDLGASDGLLGAVVGFAKRFWETPEACAARLHRTLREPRWSSAGSASYRVLEAPAPWPKAAELAGEGVRATLLGG